MLWEVFMSICLFTTLECDNINVRYGHTGSDGMAISHYGAMSIIIKPHIKNEDGIMVHEVAHLVEFKEGNDSHDQRFVLTCKDLAELTEIREICYE